MTPTDPLRYFSSCQGEQFVPLLPIQQVPSHTSRPLNSSANHQPRLSHSNNKVTGLLDQGTTPMAGADNLGFVALPAINELCEYINFNYLLLWKGISGLYYLRLYPWQWGHPGIFQTRATPGLWHGLQWAGLCLHPLTVPQKYVSQMGWSLKQTGK